MKQIAQNVRVGPGSRLAILLVAAWFCLVGGLNGFGAAVRVALMDFGVEDNSYRSAQSALSFTMLLQNELASEKDIEWVERAQLHLARQEFKLRELGVLSGGASVQAGKWLTADWTVNGRFSLDDQSRPTLLIEVIDLTRADALASETIVFPEKTALPLKVEPRQAPLAAAAVKRLLGEARQRWERAQRQTLIAPLFFCGVAPRDEFGPLKTEFYDRLEKLERANPNFRLIRFPKAYLAMEESGMVLDGLVEAGITSWEKMADLYLWGTYSSIWTGTFLNTKTNKAAAAMQMVHRLSLRLWDGTQAPLTFESEFRQPGYGRLTVGESAIFWERLEAEVGRRAAKGKVKADQPEARREAASSMVKLFRQSNPDGANPVNNRERFLNGARLIEAACFLDPANAEAQILRMDWRWGNWMENESLLKNPFWSKWRRSRAWGEYVEQFGFAGVSGRTPFANDHREIPRIYVKSLADVLEAFPRQIETVEQMRQEWSSTYQAQKKGFPKDIPQEEIREWKAQVTAELVERRHRAEAYLETLGVTNFFAIPVAPKVFATFTNRPVRPAVAPGSATTNAYASSNPRGRQPGTSPFTTPERKVFQPIPQPSLRNEGGPDTSSEPLFRLQSPNLWPMEVQPGVNEVRLPPHFETTTISKIKPWRDQLVILAVDERSAPTMEGKAEISEELLKKAGRLWLVKEDSPPKLLAAKGMPETVHAFLIENDRLWMAAQDFGYLDLNDRTFHIIRKGEGPAAPEQQAIAMGSSSLYTLRDLGLVSLDSGASKWDKLPLPNGRELVNYGSQVLLAANDRWLCYSAGWPSFYNFARAEWTNVVGLNMARCVSADAAGFWIGGSNGLNFYDPDKGSLESWYPPMSFPGIRPLRAPMELHRPLDLKTLAEAPGDVAGAAMPQTFRGPYDATNRMVKYSPPLREPLRLNSRIPGPVTALLQDGNCLWLGIGDRVALVDLTSRLVIGSRRFEGPVASLGVLNNDVWAGLAYGKQLLVRMDKRAFSNLPKVLWKPLSISDDERKQLIEKMDRRDRAMYEFYAGNVSGLAKLLETFNPHEGGANLELMLLGAFVFGPSGVDKPELCRDWCTNIIERYPESSYARFAQKELAENERNHKTRGFENFMLGKFDANHDGVLDENETKAMEKSGEYSQAKQKFDDEVLFPQLEALMRRYDKNGDGKLTRGDLETIRSSVKLFLEAPRSDRLERRKEVLEPVLSQGFPTVEVLLKKYDVDKDGALDVDELKAFVQDLRR